MEPVSDQAPPATSRVVKFGDGRHAVTSASCHEDLAVGQQAGRMEIAGRAEGVGVGPGPESAIGGRVEDLGAGCPVVTGVIAPGHQDPAVGQQGGGMAIAGRGEGTGVGPGPGVRVVNLALAVTLLTP